MLLAFLLLSAAAGAAVLEQPDARLRSFVWPSRLVWQSKQERGFDERFFVKNPKSLLDRKSGQIPEYGWDAAATAKSCVLENQGLPAGVMLDFGRELHGGVQLGFGVGTDPGMRIRVRFGESAAETMCDIGEKGATNDHAIRDDVVVAPLNGSREVGNTGFRFVRIDLVSTGKVQLDFVRAISLMRPMRRIGCFTCSDERLNRIWDTAVRTVHLCCQEYLWDGIKRDRLVWMGDTHPETMAILNVFGADGIVPDSLDYMVKMTSPGQWMNDMPTYTLWWIRNLADWYRYTGDISYLRCHAEYLEKTFEHVLSGFDGKGWWTADNFLDWPTRHNDAAATAGTQGLALMAARDMVFLSNALGRKHLTEKSADMVSRLQGLIPDPHGAKSAAALLALSGLRSPEEMFDVILGRNGHSGVSTFYGYYVLEAMSAADETCRALDTVRDYWGGMLDMGATSFWEDFNLAWTNNACRIDELPVAGKKDIHGDYGEFCYKGFRHSLCHGWSAGPAAWCINNILGIRPADVGCKTVEVKPNLGDLKWAEGAMALPTGEAVRVRAEEKVDGKLAVSVVAPDWVKVVQPNAP